MRAVVVIASWSGLSLMTAALWAVGVGGLKRRAAARQCRVDDSMRLPTPTGHEAHSTAATADLVGIDHTRSA